MRILHFSDLHFGVDHRFQPPIPPDGERPANRGYPPLSASVAADLLGGEFQGTRWRTRNGERGVPLLVALTGDLTHTADKLEFAAVDRFIDDLLSTKPLGEALSRKDVYVVPGNHDVVFAESDLGRRWFPYCDFYERHCGHRVHPEDAGRLTRLIDRSDSNLVVAEINTCVDVQKGSIEAVRGHIGPGALSKLRAELVAIPKDKLRGSVRVALLHHHPVVLPALAEAHRGYDSVVNAELLLGLLRDFGFHLVLHGHKHTPHTFSYDTQCAWTEDDVAPVVVVAGGSAGSGSLPEARSPANTYNAISIKWNPDAQEGRVCVVTRGLQLYDDRGQRLLPEQWHWRSLRIDDRVIATRRKPAANGAPKARKFNPDVDSAWNEHRQAEYKRLRNNLLVAEVRPSLLLGQAYEVELRLASTPKRQRELPVRVEWGAGHLFQVQTSSDAPDFRITYAFYGPFMALARLFFADGTMEMATVFAHLPD